MVQRQLTGGWSGCAAKPTVDDEAAHGVGQPSAEARQNRQRPGKRDEGPTALDPVNDSRRCIIGAHLKRPGAPIAVAHWCIDIAGTYDRDGYAVARETKHESLTPSDQSCLGSTIGRVIRHGSQAGKRCNQRNVPVLACAHRLDQRDNSIDRAFEVDAQLFYGVGVRFGSAPCGNASLDSGIGDYQIDRKTSVERQE